MRPIVLSTFLAAIAASVSAQPATLTGQWKVHNNIAGNESDQDCTFTQKDGVLTGTCRSDQSTVTITGKVSGKDVTWQYNSEYNGQALTIVYTGPLPTAGKLSGNVKVKEMDIDGEFTATLSTPQSK